MGIVEDKPTTARFRFTGDNKHHGGHSSLPLNIVPGLSIVKEGSLSFSTQEQAALDKLNHALVKTYLVPVEERGDAPDCKDALRSYLETMTLVGRRYRMFEIANHRIFRTKDSLIVPYDAHGRLLIHKLGCDSIRCFEQLRLPHGTLLTDAMVAGLTGLKGELIDLEVQIYQLHVDDIPMVQLSRLRDLAGLLKRLNDCGSRHEAVYLLRFLVARLCSSSYRGMPGAKNLKPEINRVRVELAEFMNGPFAERLRLPTSILVRSISGLISQPKLIDEVWQDTIDLSEVHLRGSAIANEIRRSTHHSMGKHTLKLARAYLHWFETGESRFPEPEREQTGPADEAARLNPVVKGLLERIIGNLEQLLGSAQITRRLGEWCETYAGDLTRCESKHSLHYEIGALIEKGIRANNPWVYQHGLRKLDSKLTGSNWTADARDPFERALDQLKDIRPGEPAFDAQEAENLARNAVDAFVSHIRIDHQDDLFQAIDSLLELYAEEEHFQSFERSCSLRRELESLAGDGVFNTQRYLLHQLDCILEELGFFALRHVASDYIENGVKLKECLSVVHLCAGNLERDGLFSRELWDLSAMLVNPSRTSSELLDVLEQVQRNYHRLVHRVSHAYEVMAEHLGYDQDEMRAVLANFQRTMHDLNSLVHFSDLARTFLSEQQRENSKTVVTGEQPWDFVHLSHTSDLRQRVENRQANSLQGRYGGKGGGLVYIAYLGIPTRDGFIIPTALPRLGLHISARPRLHREVLQHLRILEEDIQRNEGQSPRLGNPEAPLLLAVRGGSVFSMPGMLATMVFVGMNDTIAESLAREDEWFAWDAYRRFLVSFSAAVWDFDLEALDLVEKAKRHYGVTLKTDLSGSAMREVVENSKEAICKAGYADELDKVLSDVELQLQTAIGAVHASWDRGRARQYRAIKHLSEGWHTAVIIQQMAAGNRINRQELKPGIDEMHISLTGVIPHTRMRTTGFREFTGDIKFSACGDDLVGGITAAKSFEPVQRLHSLAPMLERKLNHAGARLRRFLGSDAEIEFTVDRGVLSVLQARSAQLSHRFSERTFSHPGKPAGIGIGISGSAFRGRVAFNQKDVRRLAAKTGAGDKTDGVLLVLENPVPDEIPLILSVDGLLAARGGSTSHAAVCVHGIEDQSYTAVLGVPELRVEADKAVLTRSDGTYKCTIKAGDILSIHGQTGEVFIGSKQLLELE